MSAELIPQYSPPPRHKSKIDSVTQYDIDELKRANRFHIPKKIAGVTAVSALTGIYSLAAIGGLSWGDDGEKPEYLQNVTLEQAEELHKFESRDMQIHRGANTPGALKKSLASGADWVDLDAKKLGNAIFITHADYPFGSLIGIDIDSHSVDFGTPDWTLQQALDEIKRFNGAHPNEKPVGVMIEPKRGAKLSTRKQMYNTLSASNLPFYIESENHGDLDVLAEIYGTGEHLLYVIRTEETMEKFLSDQVEKRRGNVLMRGRLVAPYTQKLRETGVTYVISDTADPEEAIRFLDEFGVDGISTHGLDLSQGMEMGPKTFTKEKNGFEYELAPGIKVVLEPEPFSSPKP